MEQKKKKNEGDSAGVGDCGLIEVRRTALSSRLSDLILSRSLEFC